MRFRSTAVVAVFLAPTCRRASKMGWMLVTTQRKNRTISSTYIHTGTYMFSTPCHPFRSGAVRQELCFYLCTRYILRTIHSASPWNLETYLWIVRVLLISAAHQSESCTPTRENRLVALLLFRAVSAAGAASAGAAGLAVAQGRGACVDRFGG